MSARFVIGAQPEEFTALIGEIALKPGLKNKTKNQAAQAIGRIFVQSRLAIGGKNLMRELAAFCKPPLIGGGCEF